MEGRITSRRTRLFSEVAHSMAEKCTADRAPGRDRVDRDRVDRDKAAWDKAEEDKVAQDRADRDRLDRDRGQQDKEEWPGRQRLWRGFSPRDRQEHPGQRPGQWQIGDRELHHQRPQWSPMIWWFLW